MRKVVVLRMGHRYERDKRITTHVGLVARAFGANGMILADVGDKGVEESLQKVTELWGGRFFVKSAEPWGKVIEGWKSSGGTVVHLTVYGLPIDEVLEKLPEKDLLVVVGAGKIPAEVFDLADFNISVSSQPHSEVAALAIFLDRIFKGTELKKEFKNWKMRVKPQEKGKKIERKDKNT
jgi:tRNA (cytidine56-2'-O)-methyltransferase